ncbi:MULTISPECIES: zinc-ribbon domain-containing protein [Silvimonas]|uniref:YfgJ family double zinc ribbon protein n=1 Tax=Silvimonas TaxID=300264 RepID=UPI0024B3A467|nr:MULTISPECIES: zinc-ribbon domain-containing protein [Silvimonas]MDR3428366.1 zinc-ribbon domain-containing protein [Silvimonas sp.]
MTDSQTTTPLCPDCGKPLEVLIACGARDYFCNSCNELKSKTRVREANAALFDAQSKESH